MLHKKLLLKLKRKVMTNKLMLVSKLMQLQTKLKQL
jgi:hypothetical protein